MRFETKPHARQGATSSRATNGHALSVQCNKPWGTCENDERCVLSGEQVQHAGSIIFVEAR